MASNRKILKTIRKGDLEGLKKILQESPELPNRWFSWPDERVRTYKESSSGSILHYAAYFNQPAIVEYLVREQGMDVNQPNQVSGRTPLHLAAATRSFEAAIALVHNLNADLTLRCRDGSAFNLCNDTRIQKLMQDVIDRQQLKEQEKKQEAAIVNAEGTWTALSVGEIMHDRDLPGGRYHLTDVFNFATNSWTSIIETLSNGQPMRETKPLDAATSEMISEARAELNRINGITQTPEEKKQPVPERKGPKPASDYSKIIGANL